MFLQTSCSAAYRRDEPFWCCPWHVNSEVSCNDHLLVAVAPAMLVEEAPPPLLNAFPQG